MAFFEWKDEYSVNDSNIDYQHKELVHLVNQLYENKDAQGEMRMFVGVLLDRLIDYTKYHFRDEEEAMKAGNYPKFEEHKKMHEKLAAQVLEFREKFGREEANVSVELIEFLKGWLQGHILGADKEYTPFLKHDSLF